MANTSDFYIWNSPQELIDLANRNARTRINNGEYARDARLNIQQRTEKIAIGYIGEYGFQQWCRNNNVNIEYLGENVGNGPDDGDFRTNTGLIIDVKTQENKYTPGIDWRCEVTDEQVHRDVSINLYVFSKLQIFNGNYKLRLVGWEYDNIFKQNAIYRRRGDILRGRRVHYPKWDLTIRELRPMSSLIEVIR